MINEILVLLKISLFLKNIRIIPEKAEIEGRGPPGSPGGWIGTASELETDDQGYKTRHTRKPAL